MQDPKDTRSADAGWHAIGDRAPLAIAVFNASDLLFRYANPQFIRLFSPLIPDPQGHSVAEVLGEIGTDISLLLDQVRTSGEPVRQHATLNAGDRELWFRAHAWPDAAAESLVLMLEPAAVDIQDDDLTALTTEIREVNARLVQAAVREEELAERAEAASRAKSDFLAIVSHELRTPLTAVIGYTDLLQSGIAELNQQASLWAERIRFSAWHLREIVDDLISTAVEHSDGDHTVVEEVSPAAVAEEAMALVEPRAREKGLDLRADLAGSPALMHTDNRKLRQVLTT